MSTKNRWLIALAPLALLWFACLDPPTSPITVPDAPAIQAAATAARTEFEGFIHFCESFPAERVWVTPGGVLHVRDGGNRSQWVTGNPLIDGFEENFGDLNRNLKTGDGWVHLKATLVPDAVDGTWEMTVKVPLGGGAPVRIGNGTGALRGMTLKTTEITAAPDLDNMCNPELAGSRVRGVIITPASAN